MCCTTHWLKCLHERVSCHLHGHPRCAVVRSLTLCSLPCSSPCVSPISSSVVVIGAKNHWHSAKWGVWPLGRKHPSHTGRRENSVWTKIWWIFQRTSYSIRCTGGISPKLRERQSENPWIRKESISRNLSMICFDHGRNLESIHSVCWCWRIRKDGRIRNLSQKTAKKVLINHKDGDFVFLVADGSATSSVRDYEFQEPTQIRERTVRTENLSGESQGDRDEFQPEETKDDAETQWDFWSIQGDFIYRHHVEPRVESNVPEEESFPIPLKYIWCHQVNWHRFGCNSRKTNWWLLECRRR